MTDRREDGTSKDGRVARGEITRERVLDAAERCFAERGFDAISIRQIAREADVTLGVVGFHGGTKQELFLTVLKRRVETLNALRISRLSALKATERLTLETLIDAYVTPYLEIASRGDPQWRAYAQLVARIVSDERYYLEAGPLYDRVAAVYLDEMERLCPDAGRDQLAALLSLTVASMVSIVASGIRIVGLAQSEVPDSPLAYRDLLLDFCVGGVLRALEPKC
ncbi:MAG: TetR/AcrR family transcriptional regulator [Sulfitobacter litoralis]|uniref:TetR/AcrR family transcriptional regulator n=1 Tax=Sulfitobacter litoralis TaxID=335975 RepID=UPI001B5A99B1|nr:TetR/AcrR family transcriptional regulator [Sulfitobacter litoralis]MBQ0803009.1 TetR/AcrR family transcriptional regulator [Sulfitobacter litoralis]